MSILITGATGFLGRNLAYQLKKIGYNPIALGRNKAVGDELINAGIPFISADLTNRHETISALSNVEKVVHCAGLSTVWGGKQEFELANVTGVQNILDGCLINNVTRLVHISTPSLYFDFQDKYNITEDDPLPRKFVNHYADSKKRGEDLVRNSSHDGLETVILRPRGIFGPGDTSIFPRLLSTMERGKLPIINEGKALIDITYIDNVVDAIILALDSSSAINQTYNITNDEPLSFMTLIHLLSNKLRIPFKTKNISYKKAYYSALIMESLYKFLGIKSEPPITKYGVGLISKSMTFNINKAKQELGYRPKVSIEEGFDFFANSWNHTCKKR